MKRVLVVEDEASIREMVALNLKMAGWEVVEAPSAERALELMHHGEECDAALLDIMLPGMDGLSLCETIRRENNEIGIIIVSAKGQESDKIRGLSIGADDYITKPFSVKELCARVRAVIRRKEYLSPVQDEVLTCGPISVNTAARRCLKNGEPVELTMKEFDLLVMLMRNAGRVLTRDALLDKVWGLEYFGDARTVDTHIKSLREHIGPYRKLIQTVWGVGYKFEKTDEN